MKYGCVIFSLELIIFKFFYISFKLIISVENGDKISFKRWKGATHDWYNSSPLGREIGLYELIKPFIEQFKKDIELVPVNQHYNYRKEDLFIPLTT